MLYNLLMSLFGCRISANGAVQGGGAGDENEGVQQGGVDRVGAAGSRRARARRNYAMAQPLHRYSQHPGGFPIERE